MNEARRHPKVVNIEEVSPRVEKRGNFVYSARRLGPEAGGRSLGCSYFELPAGKTAFPNHFHSSVEEALYILEGAGTLRIGTEQTGVRAGDYVAFPAGPDFAHALTNTGAHPLKYLCLSAPADPATLDIIGYPDSKKIAFASGIDPTKGLRGGAWVMKIIKDDQTIVDYYDGEPLADA